MKPVHITHTVTMPPDSEEELIFKTLVGRFNHAIESHASSMVILELYLRIRQFLAHPAIYVDAMKSKYSDRYGRKAWEGTASKMTAFGELVRRDPKPPTIVFGTFRSELDMASRELTDAGYAVWEIRGGMTDEQREHVCIQSRLAAADGTKPVALVVQIVTGNAGLNLQHCSRIIFLSSHWNPAIVDQAVARAYRMGQTQTVVVYHLLLANDAERNIDRCMVKRHGVKRAIATHIHPKLFCDSAVDSHSVLEEIDAVATAALPAFT
jgi:SNF2 family DNA or RNA helicase